MKTETKRKKAQKEDQNAYLGALHKASMKNKKEIMSDDTVDVGCFSCIRFFHKAAITEWLDKGETAECPHCGVDSVLPNPVIHPHTGEKILLTQKLLAQLNEQWFTGVVQQ